MVGITVRLTLVRLSCSTRTPPFSRTDETALKQRRIWLLLVLLFVDGRYYSIVCKEWSCYREDSRLCIYLYCTGKK
jgi:hypothetical protein